MQRKAARARTSRPKKRWFPWLIPTFFVANVVLFVVTMYENNCPKRSIPSTSCFTSFLVRIGLLYVMSGLGSSLLSTLFMQSSVSVGASGAIMGLVGRRLSYLTIHSSKSAEMWVLIVAIIISLALGLIIPNVNNFGHIGGLISGFLLGFVLLIRPRYKRISRTNSHSAPHVHLKHTPYYNALWIISFVLLSVGDPKSKTNLT